MKRKKLTKRQFIKELNKPRPTPVTSAYDLDEGGGHAGDN